MTKDMFGNRIAPLQGCETAVAGNIPLRRTLGYFALSGLRFSCGQEHPASQDVGLWRPFRAWIQLRTGTSRFAGCWVMAPFQGLGDFQSCSLFCGKVKCEFNKRLSQSNIILLFSKVEIVYSFWNIWRDWYECLEQTKLCGVGFKALKGRNPRTMEEVHRVKSAAP